MTAFVMSSSAPARHDPPAELTTNAMTILQKRYLDGGTVDQMWDRVSGGNPVFRNLLSTLRFLPNSPTLFNAGKNNGCTLSACFVFDVSDCMRRHRDGTVDNNSIVETRAKASEVAKAGGGVGYYFGNLRAKGSPIKTTHRKACGPVAVLRDYHHMSNLITQGGKRELAQMGILPCWHEDIRDFIHSKDEDPQGLSSFNISVGWTDEWVREAFAKDVQQPTNQRKLWDEQCQSAWAHGCPGMFFPNIVNRFNYNVHLGYINSPNPCGEVPNRNNEPCNLGSLSLPRYFNSCNRDINWTLLEEDIWNATLFMDYILDINVFPHPDITKAALLSRRLGLGLMGWADLLSLLHIHYNTQEALDLGDKVMSLVETISHAASEHLAAEKGPYGGYDPVKTQAPMRRNETSTSIAPTGSISIIAGVWGSIEPFYDLDCERTTAEGTKLQDGMQDWVREKLDGFVPKIASEISPEWHIRHQATFQNHTDLGVSKTVNIPNSATVEDVSRAYKLMYDLGCRGGTVYRDGSRNEQVLVKKQKTKSVFQTNNHLDLKLSLEETATVVAAAVREKTVAPTPSTTKPSRKKPRRRCLPDEVPCIRVKLKLEGFKGYLHVGLYDDGTPGEIFFRASKNGTTINGWADSWAIAFSLALQHGVPLETLCANFKGQRFEPAGFTGNKDVPLCSSVVDFAAQWLYNRFVAKAKVMTIADEILSDEEVEEKEVTPTINGRKYQGTGQMCPDCDSELIWEGNCMKCIYPACGYSRC